MAVARIREEFEEAAPVRQEQNLGVSEAQVMALLNAALGILGARLLLIVGLVGAIALAYLALQSANQTALWAQVIFSLTVFAPLVWLSARRSV